MGAPTLDPNFQGAPAFPVTINFTGPCKDLFLGDDVPAGLTVVRVFQGLTARDYFMAHAPAKPQKWFMPAMPPCVAVPSVSSLRDQEFSNRVTHWLDEGGDDPQAEAWVKARDHLAEKQAEWQTEFRKQRYVQWPAAWADEQLKARAT